MICLPYDILFLGKIQKSINAFIEKWNTHPLRTEGNKTPKQLWVLGTLSEKRKSFEEVDTMLNPNNPNYGMDPDMSRYGSEEGEESVEVDDIILGEDHELIVSSLTDNFDILRNDGNYGIDLYMQIRDHVNSFFM